jgi:hypothetical protein
VGLVPVDTKARRTRIIADDIRPGGFRAQNKKGRAGQHPMLAGWSCGNDDPEARALRVAPKRDDQLGLGVTVEIVRNGCVASNV